MAQIIELKQERERVILAAVSLDDTDDTKESLEELAELAKTAGADCIDMVIQNRERIHPGTYFGKGKIEELSELIRATKADGIICDDELSPAQMKNLEAELDTKIMDRTMLILDIFAQRANTKEGKIQVELAQLQYRSSRLIGMRNFSRLGGGIGTRGPGEKKLEEDRRLIRDRISQLKRELDEVVRNREVARAQRKRSAIPVIAIVGYTNAGKSTLMNYLTNAGVLEEDKLFATLDPTTRSYTLESGQQLLFTDTVGFIRKLPHHLIDAFRSTLEEARYADIILHMVDAANPKAYQQMYVVYDTLQSLQVKDKPVITVLNKQDLSAAEPIKDLKADRTVKLSAKTGSGIPVLLDTIEELLKEQKVYIERLISYTDAGKLSMIRKYGQLLSQDYQEDGIMIKAYLPKERANQL